MKSPDRISVIVVCKNEAGHITRCLDSVLASDTGGAELEVIVVDGLSTDGSPGLVKEIYGERVRLIENRSQYTPHGINLGIAHATGEYVAVCGARSLVSPDYLRVSVQELRHSLTWCAGGRIVQVGENPVSSNIAIAMSSRTGVGVFNFRTLTKTQQADTVSTPVFRKSLVEKIGWFDEACIRNQDDDFSYRIRKAGGRIVLNSSVHSTYFVRPSFSLLSRQYFQYGFWKIFVNRKHKTITSGRQLVPPLLILAVAGFLFIRPSVSLVLTTTYLILLLLSGVMLALREKGHAALIILAMLTLHMAYGAGYLHGVLTLLILRRPPPSYLKNLTR